MTKIKIIESPQLKIALIYFFFKAETSVLESTNALTVTFSFFIYLGSPGYI